jgi:mycothiol S-conjugate amidase
MPDSRNASRCRRVHFVRPRIPLAELPTAADPGRFAINILVYDSDTDDRTGQTRLAWSTFGSAQADPYVWGIARLDGYVPPADRPTAAADADIPHEAARSEDAPGSWPRPAAPAYLSPAAPAIVG